MSAVVDRPPVTIWRNSWAIWGLLAAAAVGLIAMYLPGLQYMVQTWDLVEEYSYGYFIPVIVAFLIWQKSDLLREQKFQPSWWGFSLLALAGLLLVAGYLSAIRLLMQYGFVVALFGLAATYLGWRGLRLIAVPLAFTLFMIPLPPFFLRELSEQLQLLSSRLGVDVIQACDISVFLEGNVIDLGILKLQVVDACSGLRYLFPLFVIGFLAAYFFRAPLWKRIVLVLSTIPLTVLINSARIGLIGITVEYWGKSMAEGILHDFEGWAMFMLCIALLILEMAVLSRIGRERMPLREAFALEFPSRSSPASPRATRPVPRSLIAAVIAILGIAALMQALPTRAKVAVARTTFAEFPLALGDWTGRTATLPPEIVQALTLDDYFLADYSRSRNEFVNLYMAYYASQSGGESTHSPRTCMPGGGWEITSLGPKVVPVGASEVPVNRAVIQRGEQRQLVYYWFKQRDRLVTNEFAVKWYIFRDGITRNRSDGALIRLVTPVAAGEPIEAADDRLKAFMSHAQPEIRRFVPD